jgi:hypothetical protein
MKNGWIWESGGSIGVALQDTNSNTLWEIYFLGGTNVYSTPAGATDIGWTDAGLDVAFTVTGADTYSAEVTPVGGSVRQFSGSLAAPATRFRAWSYNNGTGDGQNSNRDYFINNLAITSLSAGGVEPTPTSSSSPARRRPHSRRSSATSTGHRSRGRPAVQPRQQHQRRHLCRLGQPHPHSHPELAAGRRAPPSVRAAAPSTCPSPTALLPTNFYRIGYTQP